MLFTSAKAWFAAFCTRKQGPLLAGTPADKILLMMTELKEGSTPNIGDIFLIQSAIMECHNIYQPLRLKQQILESDRLEVSLTSWG